jgi:hypothetical protein
MGGRAFLVGECARAPCRQTQGLFAVRPGFYFFRVCLPVCSSRLPPSSSPSSSNLHVNSQGKAPSVEALSLTISIIWASLPEYDGFHELPSVASTCPCPPWDARETPIKGGCGQVDFSQVQSVSAYHPLLSFIQLGGKKESNRGKKKAWHFISLSSAAIAHQG